MSSKMTDEVVYTSSAGVRTYATLCIYHTDADPDVITEALGFPPDRKQIRGERLGPSRFAPVSGWFLGTQDVVVSSDVESHIIWLLDKLEHIDSDRIASLTNMGYTFIIWIFFESEVGNGGPAISHSVIAMLNKFPIDIYFDIWFDCDGQFDRAQSDECK